MKFAHLADCHIGSWREPKLAEISSKVFERAINDIKNKGVDFVLIAGDLFNTSLPPIDKLKEVVLKLKELKDLGIPVYVIAGSHDFSPSGKTMINVLEGAGLLVNVVEGEVVDGALRLNFTVDEKTGAKITGMLGKKGSLDKTYYEKLDKKNLEREDGYKIFMFHTALTEFKPSEMEKMDSAPLSLLPKGFDYYAGGHVHYIFDKSEDAYGLIAYPGALFPNSFSELEKFGSGGYYLIEDGRLSYIPVKIKDTVNIKVESKHNTPEQLEKEVISKIKDNEIKDAIITLRVKGVLESGRISDIDFKQIMDLCYDRGAWVVLKNTNGLTTKELEEVKTESLADVEETEGKLLKEHAGQIKIEFDEIEMAKNLMKALDKEKTEGERNTDFEKRLLNDLRNLIH